MTAAALTLFQVVAPIFALILTGYGTARLGILGRALSGC